MSISQHNHYINPSTPRSQAHSSRPPYFSLHISLSVRSMAAFAGTFVSVQPRPRLLRQSLVYHLLSLIYGFDSWSVFVSGVFGIDVILVLFHISLARSDRIVCFPSFFILLIGEIDLIFWIMESFFSVLAGNLW